MPLSARPHLTAIDDDLRIIVEQARWAHGYGYERAGRGLDPERGAALRERDAAEIADDDYRSGPTFDIEIGEHRARLAYRGSVQAVVFCDLTLAHVLHDVGFTKQPSVRLLAPQAPPSELDATARRARWRVVHAPDDVERTHRRSIEAIRAKLDRCVRGFSAALDQGSTEGIAHAEDAPLDRGIPLEQRCIICLYRKRRKKDGQRCSTCATYLRRHGVERPKHLDGISPIDAKAKRAARKEGWGAA